MILGAFSDSLVDKILVIINEVEGSSMFDKNSKIKDNITNKKNSINPKGLKPFEQTNNVGYIFLTNTKNPLKIEADDRRFCAIDCNSEIANNGEYFSALRKELEDPQIALKFYEYLMSIECDNYDFTKERPKTEFYNDMRETNIPIVVRFLEQEIVMNIYQDNIRDEKRIRSQGIYYASGLFDSFIKYLKDNNHKFEMTSTKFGIELKSFKSIEKRRMNVGNKYVIKYPELMDEFVKSKYVEFDLNKIEIDNDQSDDE